MGRATTNHRRQQHCRQQEQRADMCQQMQLCHVSSRGRGPASRGQEQSAKTLQQG